MEETKDHIHLLVGEDMDEDSPAVKAVAEYMRQQLEEHRRRPHS
jgi:hypothetical protein